MSTLICDSREQKWDHVQAFLAREGIKHLRSKLPVGDYGRMDNLSLVIDRKSGLSEVESNLIHQHDRFRKECIRAKENGIKLIVLVESNRIRNLDDVKTWENPRLVRWRKIDFAHSNGKMLATKIPAKPPVSGQQMHQIMVSMAEKYNVTWMFCTHQCAGEMICRMLGLWPPQPGKA